jgi:hypothetical protein
MLQYTYKNYGGKLWDILAHTLKSQISVIAAAAFAPVLLARRAV